MITLIWCITGTKGSILCKDCFTSFDALWSECSWINLISKKVIDPFLNLGIQSWIFPQKRILSQTKVCIIKIVRFCWDSLFLRQNQLKDHLKKIALHLPGEKYVLHVIQTDYNHLSNLPVWRGPHYLQKGEKN